MSSILNSISSGNLQVQQTPRDRPIKEDSIIELLQNSEIEFKILQEPKKELTKPEIEFVQDDISKYEQENYNYDGYKNITQELLQSIEISLESCLSKETLIDINTGFGENNDLRYDDPCKKPELKTPLYRENYLREFLSEEEKAAARHSLGLYNKGDVVAMSLLTAEGKSPSEQEIKNATIKQLRKGDVFFVPYTITKAVFDSDGNPIDVKINTLQQTVNTHQKQINTLLQPSNKKTITTLGDVNNFLSGFNNGDNLKKIINILDEEMLRFNATGTII